MASHMRVSRAALEIIKTFEGFRPRYQKLPDGRWIIGYGHVREVREGVQVSEAEAEALLREYDLPPIERLVSDSVMAPLNQNEFDALVSLAFNLGHRAFVSSDIVGALNGGRRLEAAEGFDTWRHARIAGKVQVIDALVRRRAAEKALFLTPPGLMAVASSRIVKPLQNLINLPPPTKAKEILVERRAETSHIPEIEIAEPEISPLEEATASVRRQMIRILGDEPEHKSAPIPSTDGPQMGGLQTDGPETEGASPQEITDAISELVNAAEDDQRPRPSVWPVHEDLPQPPSFAQAEEVFEPEPQAPRETDKIIVDDLEPVAIRPSDIERAIEVEQEVYAEERAMRLNALVPFLISALAGVMLFSLGLWGVLRAGNRPEYEAGGLVTYGPPILLICGGLLALTMGYYTIRLMFQRKA